MAGPPAPPPPPPPPAGGMAAAQPTSQALPKITPDRNALLSSIRKGTRLKKAVTNDRSGPITGGGGVISSNTALRSNASSHPSAPKVPTFAPQANHNSSASSQVAPADNSVGSQLAGILAGGMPKLKHISQTPNASSKVYSAPKVPSLRPQKKLHNASPVANAGVSKFSVPSVPSVPAPPINRPAMPSHLPSHGNNAMPIPGMPTHRPPTIRKAFDSKGTAGETASRNSNKPAFRNSGETAFRNSSEPRFRNSKGSSSTSFNAPPIPGSAPPIPSNAPPIPSNAPPVPGNAPPIPGSAPSLPKQPGMVSGQKTTTNAPPLPRNAPPVPQASSAIVRQKQTGASHKTEKVSSIPSAPPAPPLPATLAPHAPSSSPAPPLPSSAVPHTPSAPPLPASSAPPAPHLSSSKNTPLPSSNKHRTKPVQLPASSSPGALPFLADINKLRDESHVVGSEDVAKISAKRSSAPDAVPGTASNRAPNPRAPNSRASNAQRTPNAQSTASSAQPKEPANPFLAAIMNRQEQISHKASKPAGVSASTIPHVPAPSGPPPLPHTSSRRSYEETASERLGNTAAERNTAIAPTLPSAAIPSSLPSAIPSSSSHLPPPSAPPPAFPESAPSIPTVAPSAPPPPAPINRSRASSLANQRSRSSSSTAASMRSKKAPPPPPPGVAPSISSTQLYAETPEDRLEQHPKHKVFGFGVKHTFKTDDSRINSQQNVGSDLRKIDVSAYTISGSGGTGSAGHVSGEKIQIDDSRFAFNGKNNLPKPRRFSGKVKLYPSGRGSSVPLDLALFR